MLGRFVMSLVKALWITNCRSADTWLGSVGVGALTIFAASASWFRASNGGRPVNSSCAKHPNAQTSDLSLYGLSMASSGEWYKGVPKFVFAKSVVPLSTLPKPKSPITTRRESSLSPSAPKSVNTFAGFKSRCKMRSE